MNSNKVLALSAGLTLAATLFVSASASAATSSQALSNHTTMSQTSALFGANTVAGFELAREKEPKDDRGKDHDKHGKDRDSKIHKFMASGGNKPCQLYYGCVPPPTPAPKGGGGADNPKGHKFAPTAAEFQIAREKQPKDDRGNGGKDRDSKTHKFMASGGSKPCQLYYGCVPPPTPAPKGGGGGDNPKGHKSAATASEFMVAREREPRDDRGRDNKDHDKNDDHGRHGSGHKFAPTVV